MYLEISVKKFISKCSECNINYMIWWVSKQGFIHWFKVQKKKPTTNRRVAVCGDRVIIAHYPLMIENIVKKIIEDQQGHRWRHYGRESLDVTLNNTRLVNIYTKKYRELLFDIVNYQCLAKGKCTI